MSSSATVLGRRMAETVGLAKATQDEDVSLTSGKLAELEKEVKTLRAVLETANRTATQQVASARGQMSTVIMSLSSKLLRSGPDGEYFARFATVHTYLDDTLPTKLGEAFGKVVLAPVDEWLAELASARADVKEAEKKRLVFDHYGSKCAQLKEARAAAQMKGKIVDKKDIERLERNTEKFAQAAEEWHSWRDRTVGRLLHSFDTASTHLMGILARVMQ